MKRSICAVSLLLALLVTACACGNTEKKNAAAPSGEPDAVQCAFSAQYIRTDGYVDGAVYPKTTVIRSVSELTNYYDSYKETYDLERREDPATDYTVGFLDACDRYDAEYFKEKVLVLILVEEPSGSIRHEVKDVTLSGGKLTMNINRSVPETHTDDMAEWHIFVELSADVAVTSDDVIVSFYTLTATDDEHAHAAAAEEQTVSEPYAGGYCGNTVTTIYIDGEEYSFWGGYSVYLSDLLLNLDYDQNKVCRCLTEYTVDTEFGMGYGLNLSEFYARCEKGQADLTAGQVERIREIITMLQSDEIPDHDRVD